MSDVSLAPSPPAAASSPTAQVEPRSFAGLRLVSLCTLLSRVLGLVRDMGMAALFGNGVVMDAFSVAFRIPNLARRLFGEGALTAAFLPVFVREMEQSGRESAWRLATALLAWLAVVLSGLVLVGEGILWGLSTFGETTPETRLLYGLTAVMLPYLLLICLAAQVSAIQHALGHFLWPALSPVVLNVVWIGALGLVLVWRSPVAQVYTIAAAVVLAGVLQLVIPLPSLRRLGFQFDTAWGDIRSKLAGIRRAMLPIVLGLSVTQINALADSLIAWHFSAPDAVQRSEVRSQESGVSSQKSGVSRRVGLSQRTTHNGQRTSFNLQPSSFNFPLEAGTASALYFGQRLYQFPLGVFGVALGTVIFPLLSRHAERGRLDLLREDLALGLRLVLTIGLPASVGLVLVARPLTALLFQRGEFDAQDTDQTAAIIAAYGLGVWAYCGLPIVQRAYYAVGDRRAPLVAGLIAVGLNLVLSFTLIWPLGGPGLALSTAVAAVAQLLLTCRALRHRIGAFDWQPIRRTLLRASVASAAMGLACLLALNQLEAVSSGGRLLRVAVPVISGLAVYLAAARLLGLGELRLLFGRERRVE